MNMHMDLALYAREMALDTLTLDHLINSHRRMRDKVQVQSQAFANYALELDIAELTLEGLINSHRRLRTNVMQSIADRREDLQDARERGYDAAMASALANNWVSVERLRTMTMTMTMTMAEVAALIDQAA